MVQNCRTKRCRKFKHDVPKQKSYSDRNTSPWREGDFPYYFAIRKSWRGAFVTSELGSPLPSTHWHIQEKAPSIAAHFACLARLRLVIRQGVLSVTRLLFDSRTRAIRHFLAHPYINLPRQLFFNFSFIPKTYLSNILFSPFFIFNSKKEKQIQKENLNPELWNWPRLQINSARSNTRPTSELWQEPIVRVGSKNWTLIR